MGGILNPSSDNGQNRMLPLMRLKKVLGKKAKNAQKNSAKKTKNHALKKRPEMARKKVGGRYGRDEARSGHSEAATHIITHSIQPH